MPTRDQIRAAAVHYVFEHGLSVIPVNQDTKIPAMPWKKWQDELPAFDDIASWGDGWNVGIVTGAVSGIVVVDFESEADALWFVEQHGTSNVVTKTKRGYHFYFSHPGGTVKNGQRLFDRYDVRGDGGYVLAPPSSHSEGEYRWREGREFSMDKLTPFKREWRPEALTHRSERELRAITDGYAYISTIVAVSGQRGHDNTYRAACCLRASGMDEAEAMLAMLEWNKSNAQPPWSDKDLLHKVQDAYR